MSQSSPGGKGEFGSSEVGLKMAKIFEVKNMFSLFSKKIRQLKFIFASLFLVFGILFSNTSFASIGKVIYEYGDSYALDFDGNRRELKKGAAIEEGDTLVTGAGRMQVRLVDGGLISVYPNSEYKIEKFKFSAIIVSEAQQGVENNANADLEGTDLNNTGLIKLKESKTDRGFFNLLKGAARQVTGILGRKYNDNFKFKTTIATVGIRGTGFFARICQADCFDKEGHPLQDGMYVKNNVGIITMTTNAGQIALAQGQAAFAASSEDAPTQTDESPAVSGGGSGDEIETFDFDGSVSSQVITSPTLAPTIVLRTIDFTFGGDTSSGTTAVGVIDLADAGNSALQIGGEIAHFESNGAMSRFVFDKGDATLAESGLDADLGVLWNRWNGNYSLTKDGVAVASLDTNIHLIGTNQLTQNITSLAPKGDVEYVGTSATSPTLTVGENTLVGTQTFHAGLNFSGLDGGRGIELTHLSISTDFGEMKVDMHLENTLDLTSAKGVAEMHGQCEGCTGFRFERTDMNGFSTVNIVGDNAEGIFGSYNLTGEGAAISGSYVGSEVVPR